jgi:hypothetical protein
MENLQLASDVAAAVPEELLSLMDEIMKVCTDSQWDHIIPALWLLLLSAIIHSRKCTFQQGIEHATKMLMSIGIGFGTYDEMTAALSPLH